MANSIELKGTYSGRTNHFLQFYVQRLQTDEANNRSRYSWQLNAWRESGALSYALDCFTWSINIGGRTASGCHNLDFRNGAGILLASGETDWYNHDGNGNLSLYVDAFHGPAAIFGIADPAEAWFHTDRIGRIPGAPGAPSWSSIEATSAAGAWTAASRGHADIDSYLLRVHTNPNPDVGGYKDFLVGGLSAVASGLVAGTQYYGKTFAHNQDGFGPGSGVTSFLTLPPAPTGLSAPSVTPTVVNLDWNNTQSATSYDIQYATDPGFSGATQVSTGVSEASIGSLTPGTPYYFRVRARNASGAGAWSSTLTQTLLPATAPGLTVTPRPAGDAIDAQMTPPGGASGVTKYRLEWRVTGSGTVSQADVGSATTAIGGLTPGTSYDWRASAFFGDYQSPASAWQTVVQPNPNTTPGDYFDGSTAARGDVTFAWAGAVNNSTSAAMGVSVQGWHAAVTAPLTAVLSRVTGGAFGSFAARADVLTDGNAAGQLRVGPSATDPTARTPVEEGSLYVGSIYVNPSRSQRMAARLYWMNAAGGGVGTPTVGDAVVCPANQWTRLVVSTLVPAGVSVDTAVVQALDVAGTGWSAWLSGQSVRADGAMISLATLFDWFSGDTPDTAGFDFRWEGAANASVSARYELDPSNTDPLADPDCPPSPLPPALPTIAADCIDEVGTWRRYTLEIPETEVRRWSSTLPTLILNTGSSAERQVRIRYYPNVDGGPIEAATGNDWEAEQILTYIPPNTEITLDGVTRNVTAVVNGGSTVSGNRLLYGTGGIPATWPELRCGIGYVVTMDVPLEAPAGNLDSRVIVTQRM